jgi:hypothetical protein
MSEFKIKSVVSDLELVLDDVKGDYFKARIISSHINAVRDVYVYTDAYGILNLMELLASYDKPWSGKKRWEAIEGEFKISATCTKLGKVTFEVELSHCDCAEEWLVTTQINSEFGQLPMLAKAARNLLGELPE